MDRDGRRGSHRAEPTTSPTASRAEPTNSTTPGGKQSFRFLQGASGTSKAASFIVKSFFGHPVRENLPSKGFTMNTTSIARRFAVTAVAVVALGGIAAPSFAASPTKVAAKTTKMVKKAHKTAKKTTAAPAAATPSTVKK